jgi:hypothetical protein
LADRRPVHGDHLRSAGPTIQTGPLGYRRVVPSQSTRQCLPVGARYGCCVNAFRRTRCRR